MATAKTFQTVLAFLVIGPAAASASPDPAKLAEASAETPLWPDGAPGTSDWKGREFTMSGSAIGGTMRMITNTTIPSLTMVAPPPDKRNGTAVIVAPGGGFQVLAWDIEGLEIARWLADRGITAFVLKYRVRPTPPPPPRAKAALDTAEAAHKFDKPLGLARADGAQAVRLVRRDAAKLGIDPQRIGMMGFSAGAMTTVGVATNQDVSTRPNFAVSVYGSLTGETVDKTAPPVFIVAAADDNVLAPIKSVEMFEAWQKAGRPAELHLYERGHHGFGMRKQSLPVDHWSDDLERWLKQHGYLRAVQ